MGEGEHREPRGRPDADLYPWRQATKARLPGIAHGSILLSYQARWVRLCSNTDGLYELTMVEFIRLGQCGSTH